MFTVLHVMSCHESECSEDIFVLCFEIIHCHMSR